MTIQILGPLYSESNNLYGISFDGVATYGIINEFLNLAYLFYKRGFNVFLDLGYDIVPKKNNFEKPYTSEKNFYRTGLN